MIETSNIKHNENSNGNSRKTVQWMWGFMTPCLQYLTVDPRCSPRLSSTESQPRQDFWSARSRRGRWRERGTLESRIGRGPCRGRSPSGPWPSVPCAGYFGANHEAGREQPPTLRHSQSIVDVNVIDIMLLPCIQTRLLTHRVYYPGCGGWAAEVKSPAFQHLSLVMMV